MSADGVPGSSGKPAERDRDGRLAIVLVNWNGPDDTLETLESLDGITRPDVVRILVDNGSTDDSVGRFRAERLPDDPDLVLVETGENRGFAAGNLAGIRRALEDPEVAWVLLLNTDVDVAPGFVQPLVDACLDLEVGAAGPKIFYADPPDLLWAAGGRLRWRETVTEEWGTGEPDGSRWDEPRDVTYLTTCCLMIPRDVLELVGPLDPVYFIHCDDADWCRRALDAGYRLRYEPRSVIWHKVAASSGGAYTPFKTFQTGRSNALYARRHGRFFGLARFLAANLVALPLAWIREVARPAGRPGAVVSKAKGLWEGLTAPLPEPPEV